MQVLRSEIFKRNKDRDFYNRSYFGAVEDTINWANKIIISLFFTPVVAITSLFTKNGLLILANAAISFCQVSNLSVRYAFNLISFSDLLLSFLGVGFVVFVAISTTPSFFPLTYNFTNVFYSVNIIATAINTFFLLQDVLLPPIKKLIELCLNLLNIPSKGLLFSDLKLTLEKDRAILDALLRQCYKHTTYDKNISKEQISNEISVFNNMLEILVDYTNKYNTVFLGHIINQQNIKDMEKLIPELIRMCNTSNVLKFLQKKESFKKTKVDKISKAKQEILDAKSKAEESEESEDISEYNKLSVRYFSCFVEAKNTSDMNESCNQSIELLDAAIEKQKTKIEKLKKAIP